MSAIWGVVTFEEESVLEEQFRIINNACNNKYHFDNIQMISCGHARLAGGIQYINQEDRAGRIPEACKNQGFIMISDCLLDNRKELCDVLGLSDKTADCVLVYEAYLRFHSFFTDYLRGIFAIAIWDEVNRRLELFSDHTASRCLYYCRQGNQMVFSTILEPLLAYFPDLGRNQNYEKDFLLADPGVIYVVPGETPIQDVYLMTPATHKVWDKEGEHTRVYWTPKDADSQLDEAMKMCHNAKDYLSLFMDLYHNCVRDAIRNDGGTGIAMSGGLDSASLGALAADVLADSGQKLFTYTYVPYINLVEKQIGDFILDESIIVHEVAARYPNMECHTLNNCGRNAFSTMNENLRILELPFKNGLFASMNQVCQEAHNNNCKVLLHGAYGNTTVSYGDIYHIGYELYEQGKWMQLGRMLYKNCRYQGKNYLREAFKMLRCYRIAEKSSHSDVSQFIPYNGFLGRQILEGYELKKRMNQNRHLSMWHMLMDSEAYYAFLNEPALMIYLGVFETQYGLQHKMVLRDPTKDMRIIHYCRNIPYALFTHDGIPRWLIRQGFKDRLPGYVLDNWNQCGRQLIDWMDLIARDWEEIKPDVLQDIQAYAAGEDKTGSYICKKQLMEYIERVNIRENASQHRMNDILAIDSLLKYRKLYGNE